MSLTESIIACCCGPISPCEAWNAACGRPNKVTVDITHSWATTVAGTVQNRFIRETLESGTATLVLPFEKYTFSPFGLANSFTAFVGDKTKKVSFTTSATNRGWAYNTCIPATPLQPQCASTVQGSMQFDIADGQTATGVPAFTLGAQKLALVARCGGLGIEFAWGLQGYAGGGTPSLSATGRLRAYEFATQFCTPFRVARWEQDLQQCNLFGGSFGYGKVGTISTQAACVPLPYRRCPKWSEIYTAQPTNYAADRYLNMNMGWSFSRSPTQPPVQNSADGCIFMRDEWTQSDPNASAPCFVAGWAGSYQAANFRTQSISANRHFNSSVRTDLGDGQYRQETQSYNIYGGLTQGPDPGVRLDVRTDSRWRILVY